MIPHKNTHGDAGGTVIMQVVRLNRVIDHRRIEIGAFSHYRYN